jgi:hypothetical protein
MKTYVDIINRDDHRCIVKLVAGFVDKFLAQRDAAISMCMETIAANSPEGFDWLSAPSARTLGAGLYKQISDEADTFDGSDVLILTRRFAGEAMPLNTVYRALEELTGQGLVESRGLGINANKRPSQQYAVNTNGQRALGLAIMLSNHLHHCRTSDRAA